MMWIVVGIAGAVIIGIGSWQIVTRLSSKDSDPDTTRPRVVQATVDATEIAAQLDAAQAAATPTDADVQAMAMPDAAPNALASV